MFKLHLDDIQEMVKDGSYVPHPPNEVDIKLEEGIDQINFYPLKESEAFVVKYKNQEYTVKGAWISQYLE